MPSLVASVIYYALLIVWLAMIVRLIASWVFTFRRSSRASGPWAALLEFVYSITDPLLKPLQRLLPPLRVGNFAFDIAFIVLIIGVQVLMRVVAGYM